MDSTVSIKPTQRICGVPVAPLVYLAKHLAPRDDIRYYLNGVYIDPKGHLVVTNGHYMLVLDFVPDGIVEGDIGIIVSYKDLLALLKLDSFPGKTQLHRTNWLVNIEEAWQSGEEGTLTFRWNFSAADDAPLMTTKAVDGRYPDWRRVMPASVEGHTGLAAQLNPEYVYAIDTFYREMANRKQNNFAVLELLHSGTASCAQVRPLVSLNWNSRAIVMPFKGQFASNGASAELKTIADRIEFIDRAMQRLTSIECNVDSLKTETDAPLLGAKKKYLQDLTEEARTALLDLKQELAADAIRAQPAQSTACPA